MRVTIGRLRERLLRRWGFVPLARLRPVRARLEMLRDYAERSGQLTNHAKARVRLEVDFLLATLDNL